MTILQVNTHDIIGGAGRIAQSLHLHLHHLGHDCRMAVGRKQSDDPRVVQFSNAGLPYWWKRSWRYLGRHIASRFDFLPWAEWTGATVTGIGSPHTFLDDLRGREHFHFPLTRRIRDVFQLQPDIIHCHNLHGDYFDLRFLPELCKMAPVVMTLHDAWLLSGHCGHSFECDRWRIGCGQCPDLSIEPRLLRDGTAFNWQRKREIYAQCRFHLATPCHWLMDKVTQSILQPAVVESRVIPNGIDQTIFNPDDHSSARSRLGLSKKIFTLCFAANGLRTNRCKDWQTIRRALQIYANRHPSTPLKVLAIGESSPTEQIGNIEIEFVSHTSDQSTLADYYRASDLYLHAAKADTFPNTVIEALACGTPVVATAVGGIPEQVRGLMTDDQRLPTDDLNKYGIEEATGILTPIGNPEAMAQAITFLINNPQNRQRLGENAARDARARFSLDRMVNDYLGWYREILAKR